MAEFDDIAAIDELLGVGPPKDTPKPQQGSLASSNSEKEEVWLTWKQWLEHCRIKSEQEWRKKHRMKPIPPEEIKRLMETANERWLESDRVVNSFGSSLTKGS